MTPKNYISLIVNNIKNLSGFSQFLIAVIRWGTFGALATPLIVHPAFVFPFLVPKTIIFWILSEVVGASWLLLAISNPRFRPRWNWVSLSVLLYFGIMIITSLTGINPERSFWSTFARMSGTIQWAHLVFFFFALASTNKTQSDWKKIFSVSVSVAGIISALFFIEKMVTLISDTQDGSTIGNSSFFASYILFNIFIGIWLIKEAKNRTSRIFYGASIVITLFALLFSTAFGALFSFFGGIFFLFIAWLFFTYKQRAVRAAAGILLVCGIIIGIVSSIAILSQNNQALSFLSPIVPKEQIKFTIGTRIITWNSAWKAIKEKPLLGWGPENYNVAATTHFDSRLAQYDQLKGAYWFDRPHNIILEVLVHSGFVGFVGYVLLFVSALYILWFKIFHPQKKQTSNNWFVPSIMTVIFVTYIAQNLLIFDTLSSLLMFMTVLAFIAGTAKNYREESVHVALHNPSPQTTTIVFALLVYSIFIFGVRPLEAAYLSNRTNKTPKNLTKQLLFYKKSLSLSQIGNIETLDLILDNTTRVLVGTEKVSRAYIAQLEDTMVVLERKNSRNLRYPLLISKLYIAVSHLYPEYLKKAEDAAKRAIELSPANQQGYTFLAHVYLRMGEKEKAFEQFENAIRLDPNFIRAHLNLVEGYVLAGELERAYKKADEIKKIEPSILEMIDGYKPMPKKAR